MRLEDVEFPFEMPPFFSKNGSFVFNEVNSGDSKPVMEKSWLQVPEVCYIYIYVNAYCLYIYTCMNIYIYKYPHMFKKYRVVVVFNVEAYPFLG